MKSTKIKTSVGSRIFDTFNIILMIVLCLTIIFPFMYLLTLSFSDASDITLTKLVIWPKRIVLQNYVTILSYRFMLTGFQVTLTRVILGSIATMTMCCITAYPLSKRNLVFRTPFTSFMVLTMFLSGGTIPVYLNIRNLGLIDTIWALILPGVLPTYNMLIMRNYFMALPDGLEESARIDGAGYLRILVYIILPCSAPILATVFLWTVVGHWNGWYDGNLYIRTAEMKPLQNVLRSLLQNSGIATGGGSSGSIQSAPGGLAAVTAETLQAAAIIITVFPIICVYPFLQKYFVKGILVGSLKG